VTQIYSYNCHLLKYSCALICYNVTSVFPSVNTANINLLDTLEKPTDMRRRSLIPSHDAPKTDNSPVSIPRPLRSSYQRAPSSTASSRSNCDHCGNLAPSYGLTAVYGIPLKQTRAPSPLASSKEIGTYPSNYSSKVSDPNQVPIL
jgi:hypothetical protein